MEGAAEVQAEVARAGVQAEAADVALDPRLERLLRLLLLLRPMPVLPRI